MFKYYKKVEKAKIETTFGSICIENIVFDSKDIEEMLPKIILEDENLKYMFAEDELNDFKKRNIYKRFIPQEKTERDLINYINHSINFNKSFYSFLAEGLLSLIYRDIYGYKLAAGVIDVRDTLSDSHTGVDACMYDKNLGVIVLGEAKFYERLKPGMNAIISDFLNNNIKNKLESLKTISDNNYETNKIILKNLSKGEYDEITIEEFMNQKIIFAGFVLHGEKNIEKYNEVKYFDDYYVNTKILRQNICDCLRIDSYKADYKIILVHLPVNDKKELISKMIKSSKSKLKSLGEKK